MNLEMKEHGARTCSDNPNGAFGMGILVMRAYPGQRLYLLVSAQGISPRLAGKDAIIAMVLFDVHSALGGFGFESALAGESVRAAKRNLVEHLDETGCRVIEDCAAHVLGRSAFPTISVGQTAAHGGLILVYMHSVTGCELALRQRMLGFLAGP
jgi:hypothetical protein